MIWLLNILNWFYKSLSANLPTEIFIFILGVGIVMWRDRRRYKKAMEKLLLLEHQSLVLVEQVILEKVKDKRVLYFRDLPGMNFVEKLFSEQELVSFLQKLLRTEHLKIRYLN